MNILRNLSLKWKLATGFAIPLVMIVGLSAVTYQSTQSLVESTKWVNDTHEAVGLGYKLGASMVNMETGLRGFALAGRDEFLKPYYEGLVEFDKSMEDALAHVEKYPSQMERLRKVRELKEAWVGQHAEELIVLRKQVNAGDLTLSEAVQFIERGNGKRRMDELRGVLGAFLDNEYTLIEGRTEEATSLAASAINVTIFGALIAVCVGLVATVVITSLVVRPVSEASRIARSIMQGNLGNEIEVTSTDEFGTLLLSLRSMQEKLSELVGQIATSTETVLSSSNQISLGNNALRQRTDEQAASLEKTAASMEEITTTVKTSAENAADANSMAASAREQAESGSAIVSNAVEAMKDINDASTQIADITAVIDELAFQTNLLALNAAVEAARAGEQGRGFAVVASEVGSLAQRSASSAKEIKNLIQDSVNKVEEGSKLVFESGQKLNEIVLSVSKVSETVEQITVASQEQRIGIEQVNAAMIHIDEMTQENSQMVGEATKSSETMSAQAQNLSQLIAYFSKGGEQKSGVA